MYRFPITFLRYLNQWDSNFSPFLSLNLCFNVNGKLAYINSHAVLLIMICFEWWLYWMRGLNEMEISLQWMSRTDWRAALLLQSFTSYKCRRYEWIRVLRVTTRSKLPTWSVCFGCMRKKYAILTRWMSLCSQELALNGGGGKMQWSVTWQQRSVCFWIIFQLYLQLVAPVT